MPLLRERVGRAGLEVDRVSPRSTRASACRQVGVRGDHRVEDRAAVADVDRRLLELVRRLVIHGIRVGRGRRGDLGVDDVRRSRDRRRQLKFRLFTGAERARRPCSRPGVERAGGDRRRELERRGELNVDLYARCRGGADVPKANGQRLGTADHRPFGRHRKRDAEVGRTGRPRDAALEGARVAVSASDSSLIDAGDRSRGADRVVAEAERGASREEGVGRRFPGVRQDERAEERGEDALRRDGHVGRGGLASAPCPVDVVAAR